jgi:hypothetical protein
MNKSKMEWDKHMDDKKKQSHKPAKSKPAPITPEEQAKLLAAREKQQADEKAERERIELYGANVKGMSHRALVSTLTSLVKRERVKTGVKMYESIPGLTAAWGVVLLSTLVNVKTPSNVFEADQDGRPTRVARLDQMNELGALAHYIR